MTLEDIQTVVDRLQKYADHQAKILTGYGPTKSPHEVRDLHADSIAELARIVQELVNRMK